MKSFYWYDLETSGLRPNDARIMQFAGQRTDEELNAIGEPDNILIKLADDVLPEPDAVLVHGITPQKAQQEGLSEADFTEYFYGKIAIAGTVFVGYNNIRFDDEFMRRVLYRSFYDPYQWHWQDDRSRWDLLDAMRMMRALRPEGLKWPNIEGRPTVKLELMAKENGLTHDNAHDALSDVEALIELAQGFKDAQPKLFNYLLSMRDKKKVAALVEGDKSFVYTSGRYSSTHQKTTVVKTLFKHPKRDTAFVYDLREDPSKWLGMSAKKLAEHWQARYGDEIEKLPVKLIQYNRAPAIAPISVLNDATNERLAIDIKTMHNNLKILSENPEFIEAMKLALDIVEGEQQARLPLDDSVDNQMYDGFWNYGDQAELKLVRESKPEELGQLIPKIKNDRIRRLIPLYKARNYPKKLTNEERAAWEEHRAKVLFGGGDSSKAAKFFATLQEMSESKPTKDKQFLLTELQLYAESILPEQSL